MPAKKIAETPDFVQGLLNSAKAIYKLLDHGNTSARQVLQRLKNGQTKLTDLTSTERQHLGIYQARVVLIVLAAELALKFLYQKDKSKAAPEDHKIDQLFNELSPCLQEQITHQYCKLAYPPPQGWENPKQIFELCKKASVQWRYLVEENNFPEYVMQATYLIYATSSVLKVADTLPKKHKEAQTC